MKFCQKCGKEISDTAVVCIHCGEAVKSALAVSGGGQPPKNPGVGFSIASMVLGILSLVPFSGVVTAIVGLVLGVVGKKKSNDAGMPSGMATAGIICSLVGLTLGVICTIWCVCVWDVFSEAYKEAFDEAMESYNYRRNIGF